MKKKKKSTKYKALAPYLLRIMVGLLFLGPGLMKIKALSGGGHPVVGMLGGIVALAWILAIVEVLAGGMLVAGYKQSLATIPLAVILIGAIILTKAWSDPMSLLWHLVGIAALFQVYTACPCCPFDKK